MELKKYQRNVLMDLSRFLTLLMEKQNIYEAYRILWEEKNVRVGFDGMPSYNMTINGVPQVCLKVPTGGGKTFISASALKPIFDSIPNLRVKSVVWLVPSDAILTQTFRALKDTSHPYRQKLDVDFGSRVEVYSKEQLLNGQNFNPTSVTEQLSVFVLSYDSFRTNKKEGRKVYQENGNLIPFTNTIIEPELLLEDTDETALIQVVRSLNPIVVVDESHHATSKLSLKMLNDFNPSFILDLTATPRKGSNIISYVDASQLKKEEMVKLPVIVYNRKSQSNVYSDAISIRAKLEFEAIKNQIESGKYIRPIVLFQAQPKNNLDSTTYSKIKNTLIDIGIPAEQIAIKTGDVDDLKKVNLLSPDCPVRFIITVNALKEGWDCPFAYVLATVANRNSTVDVEQILGRVLRLPYTKLNRSEVLNLSYVITSSSDFYGTLDKVIEGLNFAGFGSKDYRVNDFELESKSAETEKVMDQPEQIDLMTSINSSEEIEKKDLEVLKTEYQTIMNKIENNSSNEKIENDSLFTNAIIQGKDYQNSLGVTETTNTTSVSQEVRNKMKFFKMNDEFSDEASSLMLPQFTLVTGPSLFTKNEYVLLEKDNLSKDFTLNDKDIQIDFTTTSAELAKVDIESGKESNPRAWKITGIDSSYFKEWFSSQPSEKKLLYCKGIIVKNLSAFNAINDKELRQYVDRIIQTLTEDQLTELEQSPYPFVLKIKEKVKKLVADHSALIFDKWLEQDIIMCQPNYKFNETISPLNTTSAIPKSLYIVEETMNNYERKVVWELSALDNIKWWHRNISRVGFSINGNKHAYPDIIAMTHSGKILVIETKGDHLDNDESKEKASIGFKWDKYTDRKYRYFMVFESREPGYPGGYSYERFMEIVKSL